MKIKKQYITWEEFEKIQGGDWSPGPHTHVKVDIADTPWAWADVLKTGSNLTDLATRQHAGLTDITDSQHHNKLHALTGAQHTAAGLTIGWVIKATGATTFAWGQLPHDKLAGLGDDDHAQYHNNTRGDVRYYTKTQLETSGLAAVHWGNITNEPAFYPPEYHYHVGKDIISLHLVDLDDVEADDIFDVLTTGNIHGQGNYDWWGTWVVAAGADCSAQIVVLAGVDKMLRLTDGNGATRVDADLLTDANHPMVIACIEFRIRQSTNTDEGRVYFYGGGGTTYLQMSDDGNIKFWDGAILTTLQAYTANTWYTIRIYWDCVSAAVAVWVDNVFKTRKDLAALEYINQIRFRTNVGDTGYTLDFNKLKVFNLTV